MAGYTEGLSPRGREARLPRKVHRGLRGTIPRVRGEHMWATAAGSSEAGPSSRGDGSQARFWPPIWFDSSSASLSGSRSCRPRQRVIANSLSSILFSVPARSATKGSPALSSRGRTLLRRSLDVHPRIGLPRQPRQGGSRERDTLVRPVVFEALQRHCAHGLAVGWFATRAQTIAALWGGVAWAYMLGGFMSHHEVGAWSLGFGWRSLVGRPVVARCGWLAGLDGVARRGLGGVSEVVGGADGVGVGAAWCEAGVGVVEVL